MLCRALLAAAALSYVLCVLLLSGVQKEDIDAGTLRKLQRHNVNIDDINDRQVQERCLGKTSIPINLTTLQANPTTETATGKTITAKEIPNEIYKDVGTLSADSTPLQKIVEYLEYKQKEERRKALESKDNIRKSTIGLSLFTTSPSRYSSQEPRITKNEYPITENSQIVTNDNDVKNNRAKMNKELEKLMKMWQTNIDLMSDKIKQESTTAKDDVIPKNTKDVEYITKIVAEIMSKRQFNDVKTSTIVPKRNFNSSETFRDVESNNETFLPSAYFQNNCKSDNSNANKAGDKNKNEVLETLNKRLNSGVNSPITNTNPNDEYVICKRFEPKEKEALPSHRIDDYTINYILNKLRKERQGDKIMDSKSAKFDAPLENRPTSAVFNTRSDHAKSTKTYKEIFNQLDNESAKVLQAELENQSKNIIFNRQSGRVKISDIFKERYSQLEDERVKVFDNGLENQQKLQHFDQQNDRSKTTNTFKEKPNDYPRFVKENKNLWIKYVENLKNTQNPKLEDEPARTAPKFSYNEAKQDGHGLEEEYKRWLFTYYNPSNKREQTMEMKQNNLFNSREQDHEKSTNIVNSIQFDTNHGSQYKRPWLYRELSNEPSSPQIKEKPDKLLFKPKDKEKMVNSIDPRFENVYRKIWPPYFEAVNKNTSVIRAEEQEASKNNEEPMLVDQGSPPLIQQNDREVPREIMEVSKKYPNFAGWYLNKASYVEDPSDKQFEPKKGQKINQAGILPRQNKIEHLPDEEYKSNWAYFRNKQINKQKPDMEEEHDEETEYFINSKITQQNNYQYPPGPYEENGKKPLKDTTRNRFSKYVAKEKLSNEKEKKETTKFPTFPPNVIKDIANSVKEIVLRDLKTTTIIPTTTTPSTTTTPKTTTTSSTTTTTTKPTTTTTPAITSTTTTRTTTTTKSTTTEGTLISTKDPLKIQDASKALEKIIEIFEKISSIKDKMVKLDNVKNPNDFRYDATKTTTPRTLIVQKLDQPVQFKPSPVLYPPQPAQMRSENRLPYDIQAIQLKTDNRIPYDPQSVPFKTENHAAYVPEAVQPNSGSRVPYNPLQPKAENRVPYEPLPGQFKIENRISYDPQAIQRNAANRLPYSQQTVELQAENRIPYNQPAVQLQTDNRPYDPQALQIKAENRLLYNPQRIKTENNIPYDPQPVQIKSENRMPYNAQPAQPKPENSLPYDYSAKSPYYHSKIEYDPYIEKQVLEPVTRKSEPKKMPRTYAITVQTNSGEIAPLKIAVQKPLVQNIVLTTKAPMKEENNSDETFNYRKPITSANRHQVDNNRENEVRHAREKKPFATRHTHRDAYLDIPKSRKIKKERELNEEYKPRDMQAIERFHEKLERGDAWPRYEEEKIAQRMQRPLVKKTTYDDTHFRNFLQTQQKVNAMLEKILGAGKNKQVSSEVS